MRKQIALLLLAALLCTIFSGCTMESMRRSHVVYNAQGNAVWKGKEYILLNVNTPINPLSSYDVLYATTADVPLLLREMNGDRMYASIDERFLVNIYDSVVYCRSDCYEQYKDYKIEDVSVDRYGYFYTQKDGNLGYYCMTEEETAWLNKLMMRTDNETMSEDAFYTVDMEWIVDLEACSEDLLVRMIVADILKLDDVYYINLIQEEDFTMIQIPQEESAALEKLIERTQFYMD